MRQRVEHCFVGDKVLMAVGPAGGRPGVVVVYNGETLEAEKVYHTDTMAKTAERYKKLKKELKNGNANAMVGYN